MSVLRLGYVHVRVTDLEAAKRHYGYTMGLYPTHEEAGRVYYKGWDEWDHHSVVLEEGGVGLVKLGYKVERAEDIDQIEIRAQRFGTITENNPAASMSSTRSSSSRRSSSILRARSRILGRNWRATSASGV